MSKVTQLPVKPTPPGGFKLEYFCSCGMGCTPEDLNTEDNCEIEGSVYSGPSVHLADNPGVQVNSFWTPRDGIEFRVSNRGFIGDANDAEYVEKAWTRSELEVLPDMVKRVFGLIRDAS